MNSGQWGSGAGAGGGATNVQSAAATLGVSPRPPGEWWGVWGWYPEVQCKEFPCCLQAWVTLDSFLSTGDLGFLSCQMGNSNDPQGYSKEGSDAWRKSSSCTSATPLPAPGVLLVPFPPSEAQGSG